MKCFYCGKEIDDDAHFCPLCGHDLSQLIKCPNCGCLLERNSKFCVNCGSPVVISEKKIATEIVTDKESVANTNSLVDNKGELEEDTIAIDSSQNHIANQEEVVTESEKESDDVENTEDEVESEDSHRGLIWVFVIIVLILGGIGAGWYFYYYQHSAPNSTTNGPLEVQPISVDSSEENDHQKQNVEYIKQRMEDIYTNALQDPSQNSDDAYLTSSFNAIINEATEKAYQDSDLLFDVNHWIMAQDYNHPAMKIEKISMNGNTAVADIVINDYWDYGQSHEEVRVILKFEHGDWYIDDFQNREGGKMVSSDRAVAETYLEDH